jgi:hypothetical protein
MMPPQDNFSTGSLRLDDNLTIHENRHMQQFSNFNKGFTKAFSFVLGEEGQLLANGLTVPDYFFEGDAVWQETLVSEQGRGRMPSFYNEFRSLWLGKKDYSWMKLRNGSYKDLTPDHYELGYLLTAYGYEKFGDDFWNKVTNDAVRFRGVFYPFNRAIERYSGRTYRQFRQDALQYFKPRSLPAQTGNLTSFTYLSKEENNNVIDRQFPAFITDDSILYTKRSYKSVNAFYIMYKGKEHRLRVRDLVIDDHYSYRNGRIVYAAFESDPRWTNRDYSVIKLYDIYTGMQKKIGDRSKYFSPDINPSGTEILAVEVSPLGKNNLTRIDVQSGKPVLHIPNKANYFFTQTRYLNANEAVSAVRDRTGRMRLVKVDLTTGSTADLTPPTYNVMGHPFIKDNRVYFTAMHDNADKIFCVDLLTKKIYRVTNNVNGVYYPVVNQRGELLVSAFTAGGYMLAIVKPGDFEMKLMSSSEFVRDGANKAYMESENYEKNAVAGIKNPVTKYSKSFSLFNFHSRRPIVADPEYGYSFFSDNILQSFKNTVSYTYNRSDKSHTLGLSSAYAGWFPVISLGVEGSFNRTVDTGIGKLVQYNAATINAGVSIPLRFVGGRTNKFLNVGAGYNVEQFYYTGVGKNVFSNRSIDYLNAFLNFSNVSQQARQHINPRWAQSLSLNYRDAVNFRNSYKFVAHASFYFPGLFPNHSLVINTAFQKRDTMPDLFSKIFSYSRGYEALSTRRMYKWGANYHLPLVYPDWGFANILYFQRIRANVFYDHTVARARVNSVLTDILSRSTGAEVYFDTKWWNSFPVSIGVRFAHLLDTDLVNPLVKNRWEIIIPIGLIPD